MPSASIWKCWVAAGVLAAAALVPTNAFAYVGIGAGLSAIGSLLGVLVAFFMMLVGFVWYPNKRLMRRKKRPPG
jgi:uncharacterized membrane protein YdjX (TVP38/TMEM64 family)